MGEKSEVKDIKLSDNFMGKVTFSLHKIHIWFNLFFILRSHR